MSSLGVSGEARRPLRLGFRVWQGERAAIGQEEKAMDSEEKERLVVEPYLSETPEIGRWLWALQDARQRTLRELGRQTSGMIDWAPPGHESTIGTVLYHLADIEADWLYVEVLEQPLPPEVAALFAYPTRDGQGALTQVTGFSLEAHLRRLEIVRGLLLGVFQPMGLGEFRRARTLPQYEVTPEWVLHHLMQHEAEHRGQIGNLRERAERERGMS
jgi:uncharacterized damage-inducible protein DinB